MDFAQVCFLNKLLFSQTIIVRKFCLFEAISPFRALIKTSSMLGRRTMAPMRPLLHEGTNYSL